MIFLMDPEFWARVFGIIVIDLTLAGDNALVIALAVRSLPRRQQLLDRKSTRLNSSHPQLSRMPSSA